MTKEELTKKAIEYLSHAYAPYSGFHVAAALLTKSGKVYLGCNIENSSYGATNCAERTAFFKAVSEEEREFEAIAIVGGHGKGEAALLDYAYPCGICRQVMREFCRPEEFKVILYKNTGGYLVRTLEELMPCSFGPENLLGD